MPSNPLISIVIPTWNRVDTVVRAVESVNYYKNNIEIVVVDNASEQNIYNSLKEQLEKYNNVFLYRNETNIGMVANWNKAIELANGQWISLMCSDDEFYPDAFSRVTEIIKSNNYPCLIIQSLEISDDIEFSEHGIETVKNLNLPIVSGNFWHRSITEIIGGFDTRLKYSPDAEFWLRIAFNYPIIKVRQPFAKYNIHNSNFMWDTWAMDDFLDQITLLATINLNYFYVKMPDISQQEEILLSGQVETLKTMLTLLKKEKSRTSLFTRYYFKAWGIFHGYKNRIFLVRVLLSKIYNQI